MKYLYRAVELALYAAAAFTIASSITGLPAHAAECELTQVEAMAHLNKAAKELPATVTVIDGAKAADFIATANALQSDQVFDGDTIAVIGLTNQDLVQVTMFKEECRTYQSKDMTHAQWAAVIKAVSDAQSRPL